MFGIFWVMLGIIDILKCSIVTKFGGLHAHLVARIWENTAGLLWIHGFIGAIGMNYWGHSRIVTHFDESNSRKNYRVINFLFNIDDGDLVDINY